MENRTNKIIKFSDEEKYFVLKQAVYKGKSYYMTVKTTPDGENFTDEFQILQEDIRDEKSYFSRVKDEQTLSVLLKYLDAPEDKKEA